MSAPPRVLTVAGSDSGGGAGIQADLKTMLALGVHGMSVLTAVTAQNSLGVQGAWELPAEAVRAQYRSVVDDIGVQAVKTGMLSSAELVETVADLLAGSDAPTVVDPVGVSSTATRCWRRPRWTPSARSCCRWPPWSRRTWTRSRSSPACGWPPSGTCGGRGGRAGVRPALGGDQGRASDRHRVGGGRRPPHGRHGGTLAARPRHDNRHTHGTGCTLASAIASHLALGRTVPEAVTAAKTYVTGALASGFALGGGIGPVNHAWALRRGEA